MDKLITPEWLLNKIEEIGQKPGGLMAVSPERLKGHNIIEEAKKMLYYPKLDGCSDGNCLLKDNSVGMRTNGGCSCERELRRVPKGFDATRTIRLLRANLKSALEALAKLENTTDNPKPLP